MTDATRANVVEPHCIPSMVTLSPLAPLETRPDNVGEEP
jgi:hypothetical protein